MANPPPLAPTSQALDRALTLAAEGDLEEALAWSLAALRRGVGSGVALLLTARWAFELGREAAALEGLKACVQHAIAAGQLPVAVAACAELRRLGADASAGYSAISEAYAAGSSAHEGASVSPPAIPGAAQEELAPLDIRGEMLADAAEEALRELPPAGALRGLPHAPLFSALGAEALSAFIELFELRVAPVGACLIEEGALGEEAFVVVRGELEVSRAAREEGAPPIPLARLGAGALVGEMALISRAPRAATVCCVRPSLVLSAGKAGVDALAAREPALGDEFAAQFRRRMLDNLVRTSEVLRAVSPRQRPALIERFVTRAYDAGERLIEQDQPSDGLHLIASGAVEVIHRDPAGDLALAALGVGEVVGEVALVLRRPSTADVVASAPTVTLHLPRSEFQQAIKEHPQLLAELYDLATRRDEQTSSIVAQETTEVDDFVLI
ncbi:MAG: cyclic nucleotide-binding domain-containing protein [Polyangiaceae bacterium]|nr:cyclic nucleotide-binding domain-containing protein [Polyangiaceae bacterium]MCW5789632.1 cyclic nucleotide-binding domain-containing protein [Polyangiaceae bacterium]